MTVIKKIKVIILVFLLLNNFDKAISAETIVYIDLNKLMKTSLVGKSLSKKLLKNKDTNSKKFQKILDTLKDKQKNINSQKNVLDAAEYQKKFHDLKVEFDDYRKSIEKLNQNVNKEKIKDEKLIMNSLTPILADYSKNNGTSMILNKRDIIIAKSELDITDFIIVELNKKIKEIK